MDSSSLRKSLEQGKLVSKSGLLDKAWSKIQTTHGNQDSGPGFKTYQEGMYTIVVFVAPRCPLDSDPTPPLCGPKDQNPFYFLYSDNVSSFSLHKPAYQHFETLRKDLFHLEEQLLDLLESKKHVIITGAALGGAVASLFTLWLLESIKPTLKRPLCITFGSPFVVDVNLQQTLENSLRSSCFLHVADASQTPVTQRFKPFGTFLVCVGGQCICIDDPETVTELLGGADGDEVRWRDYGQVLGRMAQPLAVDSVQMVDDGVISRMAERAENKKPRFDRLKKLNDMKIHMIYFERYKKKSKEFEMSFYDWYKTSMESPSPVSMDTKKRKTEMNDYWISLVEEVEKMPQSENSLLKTRSLLAANNYRRMVEPLDIAEYYRDGRREYRSTGRSRHYVMLEKWFKEKETKPDRWEKRDLSDLLTFDSCFLAKLEEAMLLTKTQILVSTAELLMFEKDVWEMIEKREVSPEIFLERSSFMKWWREYRAIKGSPSPFTRFMNTGEYKRYGQAC